MGFRNEKAGNTICKRVANNKARPFFHEKLTTSTGKGSPTLLWGREIRILVF